MATSNGEPYSTKIGGWKAIKDGLMLAVATSGAWVIANSVGIAEQCPDAVITVGGAAISLKLIMQFLNNYRKNA